MPQPYSIQLVGTARRADAVASVAEGERVTLLHEIDNPYDDRAIAVLSAAGAMLGYLPGDSWAKDALIDEEKGCRATIAVIDAPAKVVIEVVLHGDPIGTREFAA